MKKRFATAQFCGDRRHATVHGPSAYRLMLVTGSLIVWLACWAFPVNGQAGNALSAGEGRFWLRSGDQFEGRIEGMRDGTNTLEVRHPLVAEVLAIETAALARFEAARRTGFPLSAHWQVDLANGDRLGGKIKGFSANGLDLETASVGQVTIPREWLRSITRLGGAPPVLDGPGAPADWKIFDMESLQEACGGGFKLPQGSISRTIPEMPDIFRLDMEIQYSGRPNWLLRFYASDVGIQNVSCYLLHRSDSAFQLSQHSSAKDGEPRGSRRSLAMAKLGATGGGLTTEPQTETVSILFDRPRQTMRIFMNGEPVCTWTGIAPLDAFGNILTLNVQWGMNGTELRDIRLAPLAGLPPDTADGKAPGDGDGVWLADGRCLAGTVDSLAADGTLRLRVAAGAVEVAADDILHLAFAAPAEPAAQRQGDALVALRDGSRISLGLTGIEEGMIAGQSAATGAFRLRLADVRTIDWQRDEAKAEAPATGKFELRNGDRLSGAIASWNPLERTMRLRHPHIRDSLTVAFADLREHKASSRMDEVWPVWQVDFGTGEERLAAKDLRLDETRLTLQNRYAGTLAVPRQAASVLSYTKDTPPLVRGIDQAAWRTSDGDAAPTFAADGSGVLLPPNGFITRALSALPDKLRIEIEAQTHTQGAVVQLALRASGPGQENVTGDLLFLGPNRMHLRRTQLQVARGQPAENGLLQMPFPLLTAARQSRWTPSIDGLATHRYTILVDQLQRAMMIYVDGERVADWQNVVPLAAPGRFFTIGSTRQFPVRITDLLVAEWDGRLPDAEAQETLTDMEVMHLRNGDFTACRVRTIDAGQVRAETARLTLDIPVARLSHLRLAGVGEPVDTWAMDTELALADGSLLRMEASLMTLEGGQIAGVSPHLGHVQVPLEAVRSIRWYDKTNRRGTAPTLLKTGGRPSAASTVDPPPVTIPHLETLEVDADLDAWKAVPGHRIPENTDIALTNRPEIRLAWNQGGLYVRFAVTDRNLNEADKVEELFLGSGVELYVAPQRGSPQMIQTIISPGFDGRHNELRSLMLDYRPVRPTRPTIETLARRTRDGYVLTVRFPWRNLDLTASQGDEIAVQCFVNRFEGDTLQALPWHPETGTFQDANRMRRVTLGPAPEAL